MTVEYKHINPFMRFSRGIISCLDDDGNLCLRSGKSSIKLDIKKDSLNIRQIENIQSRFNIKLVGFKDDAFPYSCTIVTIKKHNARLLDIEYEEMRNLQDALLNNVRLILFGPIPCDELESYESLLPIAFKYCGTIEGRKDELQKAYEKYCELLGYKFINSIISLYDIQFLIYDILSILARSLDTFRSLNEKLIKILDARYPTTKFLEDFFGSDTDSWELEFTGIDVDEIGHKFIEIVISLRSALDVMTRLFFTINLLDHYKGNKIITIPKKGYNSLKNISFPSDFSSPHVEKSILKNRFKALTHLRNDLIHNTTLDRPRPKVYVGYNTSFVNNEKIAYCDYLMRDFDNNGQAVKWWNRTNFKSQYRIAQHVLIKWILEIFDSIKHSFLFLIDYTDYIIKKNPRDRLKIEFNFPQESQNSNCR